MGKRLNKEERNGQEGLTHEKSMPHNSVHCPPPPTGFGNLSNVSQLFCNHLTRLFTTPEGSKDWFSSQHGHHQSEEKRWSSRCCRPDTVFTVQRSEINSTSCPIVIRVGNRSTLKSRACVSHFCPFHDLAPGNCQTK